MNPSTSSQPPASWLIRISEVFEGFSQEIVHGLSGEISKKMGTEYYLIQSSEPTKIHQSESAKFIRWNLPVEHAWPCNPEKMEGFVEKAAQALARKFGPRAPQAIFMGQLDPSATHRYYKTLASNLRGRTLQLFSEKVATFKDVEAQTSEAPTLFCLIGKEGLFAGMQSPKASNGLYPGGTKYVSQNSPDTISRAGAKLAEALHFLLMHRSPVRKGLHWLELGASPGGMTSELLTRGYKVTAIDRAPLDKRLDRHPQMVFAQLDVAGFKPNSKMRYDAILSDMNGDPRDSIRQVARLSQNLNSNGLVIFTLKTTGISTFQEINELAVSVIELAAASGLIWFATTHLTYNRQEFTLFFERKFSE